jgi:hypothetical protein
MRIGQSSSLQLSFADYAYFLLSAFVGVWQAWCATYGRNSLLLPFLMSLPFALASYGHAALLNKAGVVDERPNWKGLLALWAGMPLSLVVCFLTVLIATRAMSAVDGGADSIPFYDLRLLIGECAGSVVWAGCLLVWSGLPGPRLSMRRLPGVSAILFAGVLIAYGLAAPIFRRFHKDILILLTSVVTTLISAVIVVLLEKRSWRVGGTDLGKPATG